MKIAQKLIQDKRAKSTISAIVLKTFIDLRYNNLKLHLSQVDATRMADTLVKALAIQATHHSDHKND